MRQEDLEKSEERYRMLFKHSPFGIVYFDQDGVLVDCNQKFAEMMGSSRNDLMGFDIFQSMKDRAMLSAIAKALSGNIGHYEGDYLSITGGKLIAMRAVHSPVTSEDGSRLGAVSIYEDITERKRIEQELLEREKELQIRSQNLEEMNIALRVLLNKRDKDKMELEEKVLTNVKELVAPHLERLKNSGLNERQIAIANVLVSSLEDIISSFSRRLTKTYLCFTSTEIQIADLVKYGKTSKEIAEFLGVCNETINFHRKNIRRKIGLRNKKSSLRAFLLSIN